MLTTIRLFSPNYKMVFSFVLINLMVISGITIYQITNIDHGELTMEGYPVEFYQTETDIYWIEAIQVSSHFIGDTREYRDYKYTLNTFNGHSVFQITLLEYRIYENEFGNSTSINFDIIMIENNQILISITETLRYKLGKTPSEIQFSPLFKEFNKYFIVISNFEFRKSDMVRYRTVRSYTSDNITLSQIKYNQETRNSAWMFHLNDNKTIMNSTYFEGDYYISSDELLQKFIAKLMILEDDKVVNRAITEIEEGESIYSDTILSYNTTQFLKDQYSETLGLSPVPFSDDVNIELIDSFNNIHFIGKFTNYINIEGNYTGINNPNYLVIDPQTNQSQFWELVPSGGRYDLEAFYLLEHDNGSVIMITEGPVIGEYYIDKSKNFEDESFDDNRYSTWWQSNFIQVAIFHPFKPQLENFIQFDNEISQTPESTVIYPRIPETLVLPVDKTFGERNFTPLITEHLGTSVLRIFDSYYDTNNGLLAFYHANDSEIYWWSSYGQSLVVLEVNIDKEQPDYIGHKVLKGPDSMVKDRYDDHEKLQSSLEGWSIPRIFGIFNIVSNQEILTVAFVQGEYGIRPMSFLDTKYVEDDIILTFNQEDLVLL